MIKRIKIEKIERDYKLALFFNDMSKTLDGIGIYCNPMFADSTIGESFEANASIYYSLGFVEYYSGRLVEYLKESIELLDEYSSEFNSSWRYYAVFRHIGLIKEYGGEDTDYDTNGNIRTDWKDSELEHSSIVYDILDTTNDAIWKIEPKDMHSVYLLIRLASKITFSKFLSETNGAYISTYIKNEEGELIQQSRMDQQISDIEHEFHCSNMEDFLYSVVHFFTVIMNKIRALKFDKDNKEELQAIRKNMYDLLHFNIPILELPNKEEVSYE